MADRFDNPALAYLVELWEFLTGTAGGQNVASVSGALQPGDASLSYSASQFSGAPQLDGIVEGDETDNQIDLFYTGDPEGDRIDHGDAIAPGAGPDDDVVDALGGDDVVLARFGDDTVYAGTGDDVVFGQDGNDLIFGDSSLDPYATREVFQWDLAPDLNGPDPIDDVDHIRDFTQDTGTVDVSFRILDLPPGADHEFSATDQLVDGITGDGNPVDANSSFFNDLDTDGSTGNYEITFSQAVTNVSFRINDVDGDSVARLLAFGPDGQPVPVDLNAGSKVIISDELAPAGDDTMTSTGGLGPDTSPDYSVLVGIDGPVSKIVLVHERTGPEVSGIKVTDIYFDGIGPLKADDVLSGGDGDDVIFGEFGDDTLLGDDGSDVLDGGDGDDHLFGGAGVDFLVGGAGSDNLAGGDGNDLLSGSNNIPGDKGDVLLGEFGDDTFINPGDDDFIDGGEDPDGLDFDVLNLHGVVAELAPGGSLKVNFVNNDPATEAGTVHVYDSGGTEVGTIKFQNIEQVIPCFTPGTRIATPKGERMVEDLKVGDRVLTRDNGIQTIRWIGHRTLSGWELAKADNLNPILIRQGALGYGLPERDMMVSPQHRVLVSNDKTAVYFDESEVLIAAKHLVCLEGVEAVKVPQITYIHFMFDRHEVVLSDGAWTESFQPGDQSLAGLGAAQRAELGELFPDLLTPAGIGGYQSARRSLKGHEARVLLS